jgi:uncharacterized protein (DUF433 family)
MPQDKIPEIPKSLTAQQARDFILDVKAGLSEEDLAKKYDLPAKSVYLHKLAVKSYMAEKAGSNVVKPALKISAELVLEDIKSGLDNEGLMNRYELTERQLQRLYRKIIEAGLMTPLELAARLKITSSQIMEAFSEAQQPIDETD